MRNEKKKNNNKQVTALANHRYYGCGCYAFILLPSFLLKSSQRSTIPVIPLLVRNKLNGTDQQIGVVLASVGLGKLLGNLPSGQYVGYYGSSRGLIWSCVLLSLAWLLAATSPHVIGLLCSGGMEGLGLALWQVSRQNLVTSKIGKDQGRGKVQATVGGLERLSSVVGPSVGGYVALRYGLRAPFFLKAGLLALDALIFQLWRTLGLTDVPEGYHREEPRVPEQTRPSSFFTNVSSTLEHHWKRLSVVSVWVMLLPIARETRLFLIPLRAMDLGMGPHEIGLLTSITFIVDTGMFPLSGYLMDAWGRKYVGIPSGVLMALAYMLAPWATNVRTLTLVSALGGMGNGLSGGVLTSVGSDMAPETNDLQRAMFLGMYRTISDAGIFLGPLVSGVVAERLTTHMAFYVIASLDVVFVSLDGYCCARNKVAIETSIVGPPLLEASHASFFSSLETFGGRYVSERYESL